MKYGLLFHYWMKDTGKCNYLEVAKKIKREKPRWL